MHARGRNYAFIDSQNLNLGIRSLGWKLDFAKFRIYLRDKYAVEKAFLFIGHVLENQPLYDSLSRFGYYCVFKPTIRYGNGEIKGNCDAELVLHTMIEWMHYDKAIIVTGDGDFACLIDHLAKEGKLAAVIIPNGDKFSGLLKRKSFRRYLRYLNQMNIKLGKT